MEKQTIRQNKLDYVFYKIGGYIYYENTDLAGAKRKKR